MAAKNFLIFYGVFDIQASLLALLVLQTAVVDKLMSALKDQRCFRFNHFSKSLWIE